MSPGSQVPHRIRLIPFRAILKLFLWSIKLSKGFRTAPSHINSQRHFHFHFPSITLSSARAKKALIKFSRFRGNKILQVGEKLFFSLFAPQPNVLSRSFFQSRKTNYRRGGTPNEIKLNEPLQNLSYMKTKQNLT